MTEESRFEAINRQVDSEVNRTPTHRPRMGRALGTMRCAALLRSGEPCHEFIGTYIPEGVVDDKGTLWSGHGADRRAGRPGHRLQGAQFRLREHMRETGEREGLVVYGLAAWRRKRRASGLPEGRLGEDYERVPMPPGSIRLGKAAGHSIDLGVTPQLLVQCPACGEVSLVDSVELRAAYDHASARSFSWARHLVSKRGFPPIA